MPRTRPYVFVPATPRTACGSPPTHTAPHGYPLVSWPTPRHTARWTEAEIQTLAELVTRRSRLAIARQLGRTPRAVEAMQQRRPGLWATQQDAVTARQAAQIIGVSHTVMYRWLAAGRLRAHRLPGGRVWLIDVREVERVRRDRADAPVVPSRSRS